MPSPTVVKSTSRHRSADIQSPTSTPGPRTHTRRPTRKRQTTSTRTHPRGPTPRAEGARRRTHPGNGVIPRHPHTRRSWECITDAERPIPNDSTADESGRRFNGRGSARRRLPHKARTGTGEEGRRILKQRPGARRSHSALTGSPRTSTTPSQPRGNTRTRRPIDPVTGRRGASIRDAAGGASRRHLAYPRDLLRQSDGIVCTRQCRGSAQGGTGGTTLSTPPADNGTAVRDCGKLQWNRRLGA